MKLDELPRPDLAHTSCGICGEAWQTPEPPPLPEGYFDAVEFLGQLAEHPGEEVDLDKVATAQAIIDQREAQAAGYRLDAAAFQATHDHAETHTLAEHLEHAHDNRIPLTCAKCGHEEQSTQAGYDAIQQHTKGCKGKPTYPRERAYPPEG